MTFKEWVKLTTKSTHTAIPRELVEEIMISAIRVAIEEMMANKAEADLDIMNIGRFYLNHRVCHNNFYREGQSEYPVKWTLHFTPRRSLKDVFNGLRDIHDLNFGHATPLYPDWEEIAQRNGERTKFVVVRKTRALKGGRPKKGEKRRPLRRVCR